MGEYQIIASQWTFLNLLLLKFLIIKKGMRISAMARLILPIFLYSGVWSRKTQIPSNSVTAVKPRKLESEVITVGVIPCLKNSIARSFSCSAAEVREGG